MARIRKEDHARILSLVDVERRAVREIASEFGCTPAAIYALLTKLRREAAGAAPRPSETQPPLALDEERDAEALTPLAAPEPPSVTPASPPAASPPPTSLQPASAAPASAPGEERRVVTFERAAPAGLGGKLAKPGMGLMMRTPDGEETMTPFRSLDDLLSAIKPILRGCARSPEPVWFSLQPVDLATIDVDAA